jgi:hypothetical protein
MQYVFNRLDKIVSFLEDSLCWSKYMLSDSICHHLDPWDLSNTEREV